MRLKKVFTSVLAVLLMLSFVAVTSACSKAKSSTNSSTTKSGIGADALFTNTMTGEEMYKGGYLPSIFVRGAQYRSLRQINTLMLTDNNIKKKTYVLTKNFYSGAMALQVYAAFYGKYTVAKDGVTVTLNSPDHYSWCSYDAGKMGNPKSVTYVPVNLKLDNNKSIKDGCSFHGDFLGKFGYHKTEPMNVVVNTTDSTFKFDLETNKDTTAAVGAENEDDGFVAGDPFPDHAQSNAGGK
jgi:hypothetical protein